MPNATLLLNNFHLGGLADSKYSGISNSFANSSGLNLHSEPGVVKVNQKLTKESGSTIDSFVSRILPASDGKSYLFSKTSGKIWERASNGAYTLVHTDGNSSPGILNAIEHAGYIYWFTSAKVGRWQIGTAWAGANDAYATFDNGNSLHHPAIIKNLVLYIGDGYKVAQIDEAHVFVADALDLEKQYVMTAIGEVSNDVVLGNIIASNVAYTKVFRWNTYAPSFTSDDLVPEVGVTCFIPVDNGVMAYCGTKGKLYTYNGESMEQLKRILGDWTSTNKATVFQGASANFQGLPMFGLSNVSGNPALQGVYSFGGFSTNYPPVLNLEYVLSTGHTSNVQIGAMAVVGDDLLVAWQDDNGGTTYGVDKVDWTAKATAALLETRVLTLDRMAGKSLSVKIGYRTQAGTGITLRASVNGGAYAAQTLRQDTLRGVFETAVNIGDAATVQLEITLTPSGNTGPEIEAVEISY